MDKLYRRTVGLLVTDKSDSSGGKKQDDDKGIKFENELDARVDNNAAEPSLLCKKLSAAAAAFQMHETEHRTQQQRSMQSSAAGTGKSLSNCFKFSDKPLRPTNNNKNGNNEPDKSQTSPSASFNDCLKPITRSRLATLSQIGEDWLYLALLGIIMAFLSFSMDSIITLFLNMRLWLSQEMDEQNLLIQYLAWCVTPILLVTFSTGFVHLCSPTAIGSGIPEMKTILRGVVLNEYLTFRTLVAKIVGLTFTLGSGLPLGKEGPSVHMASIVATLLSKLVASFQGIYENESRTSEMLSAACAVGVAATFYAPIGGVLFSIEVTTVYFAVRNYWRGFFAACCGATVWRLLGFWIKNDESISALFKTNFSTDYPFEPIELLVFSFIGATSGLAGAAYIKFHREIVQFFRRHKRISGFLQQNRFVYPTLVTLIITSSTFPPFIGKYTASTLSTHTTIEHLFSNRTWGLGNQDLTSNNILEQWTTPDTDFRLHLILYIVMLFWTSALASTIPTPSGVFIPVLKMGAAYGRLMGELMAMAYPNGIKYPHKAAIVPGSYAVVGAAAFSGAVTHTVSTSVILFEMTGQIVHIIPVILGVLISNAVCQSLQPSIYDSIIEIKKLPYLPPIASSNSVSHKILVRDFMNTKIPFVWKKKCTYADLKALLSSHKKIMSFPLVESPDTMKLLGSVPRPDLLKLLYLHLGRERRLQEVCRRNSDTLAPAIQLLNTISGRVASETDADRRPASNQGQAKDLKKMEQPPAQQQQQISKLKRSESAPQTEMASAVIKMTTSSDDDDTGSSTSSSSNDGARLIIAKKGATREPHTAAILSAVQEKDSTGVPQLIVTASRPQNSKATTAGARQGQLQRQSSLGPVPVSGIKRVSVQVPIIEGDQLLSDCQQAPGDRLSTSEVQSIAKIINHYNRGSSMDEERLDKSIQEVEDHMSTASKEPTELVVIVQTSANREHEQPQPTRNEDLQKKTVANEVVPLGYQSSQKPDTFDCGSISTARPRTFQDGKPTAQMGSHSLAPPRTNFMPSSPSLSSRPTKSILKTSSFNNMTKRNISAQSFSSAQFSVMDSGNRNNHGSYHLQVASTSKQAPMHGLKSSSSASTATLMENQRDHYTFTIGDGSQLDQDATIKSINQTVSHTQPHDQINPNRTDLSLQQTVGASTITRRKVRLPRLRVVDMTSEEQEQWEKEQLNASIDISRCQIDEAPFQLVEQTSLYRVHTLFSMLGLNHAYVTSFGRLVGIVALKDIRYALERMFQEK